MYLKEDKEELRQTLASIQELINKAVAMAGHTGRIKKESWTLDWETIKKVHPFVTWITSDYQGFIVGHESEPSLGEGIWFSEGRTVDLSLHCHFIGDFRYSKVQLV